VSTLWCSLASGATVVQQSRSRESASRIYITRSHSGPLIISFFGTGTQAKPSCSSPKLGYQFDSATASALYVLSCSTPELRFTYPLRQSQLDDLTHIVSKALTAALVLHPIACGLAFISLAVTIFALLRRRRHFQIHGTERDGRSRFTSIITFAIILPAALLTTVVFIVDVVLVAIARNKLRDSLDGSRSVSLTWDSAVSLNVSSRTLN
jgi:hypothetical protein